MTQAQCQQCSKSFRIDDRELEFLKTMAVPEPAFCADCSMQIRMAWRNERSLYTRPCAHCGKAMVTIYADNDVYTVYCNTCWWSGDWDPTTYGQEYDFTRPFFEQMDELLKKVPLVNLVIGAKSENSDYTNYSMDNKNSYLLAASDYNEDCMYSSYIFECRDCADCLFVNNCDASYQLVNCSNCYGSQSLQDCQQCTECAYSFDCQSCTNCFGCVGLRHKEYHIFNKPYTKEAYAAKIVELKKNPAEVIRKVEELKLLHPHKFAFNINCNDCVGDYLTQCESCQNCYDMVQTVGCTDCSLGLNGKDCYRCVGVPNAEMAYECVAVPEDYHLKFCALIWPKSTFLEYCLFSRSSNNCFGSVALNNNQYCILNKQYTKDEYERLLPKMIDHMTTTGEYGLFFPAKMSPFAYNKTAAQDYYPLSKEEIIKHGWKYREPEQLTTKSGDDIMTCSECDRQFKLIPQEKQFYEQHGISLPAHCSDCRHQARLKQRNPRNLWKRQCMCTQPDHDHGGLSGRDGGSAKRCETEFTTTYSPDRKEIVYCEKCYQKEMY